MSREKQDIEDLKNEDGIFEIIKPENQNIGDILKENKKLKKEIEKLNAKIAELESKIESYAEELAGEDW